jgi:hypothetical protein
VHCHRNPHIAICNRAANVSGASACSTQGTAIKSKSRRGEIKQVEQLVIFDLHVVLTADAVEAELDVRDFGGYGVDGRAGPAGEVRHRLGGVDALAPLGR